MNTFGELNEPSSRSAWEDWDDDQVMETLPELHLQKNVENLARIETFMILEGRYLYDCVKTQSDSLELVNSIPEVNLLIYKTKEYNNYICIIKDYNLVQSSEIVEAIKDYLINSNDVLTVTMKPLVDYQVENLITKDYIIRCLSTSKQSSKIINSRPSSLEQPNMICGMAAGALCFREIIDQPAVAFVCYIDHPEDQEIYELNNVLQTLHIQPFVKHIKNINLLNSNLYI